jgi:hypothetical protein
MVRWSVPLLFALLLAGCRMDPSADVVGTWGVDLASSNLPSTNPEQNLFAQAALSAVRVEIRADGSFELNLMRSQKGTWKYDGETLYLSPESGSRGAQSLRTIEGRGNVKMRFLSKENRLEWKLESPVSATLRLMRVAEETKA